MITHADGFKTSRTNAEQSVSCGVERGEQGSGEDEEWSKGKSGRDERDGALGRTRRLEKTGGFLQREDEKSDSNKSNICMR